MFLETYRAKTFEAIETLPPNSSSVVTLLERYQTLKDCVNYFETLANQGKIANMLEEMETYAD